MNFYVTDVELLFSSQPFMIASSDTSSSDSSCTLVAPNETLSIALEGEEGVAKIPSSLLARNLLIQVTAGPKAETLSYIPTTMDCQVR